MDTETGSTISGGRGGSCVEVDCGPGIEVDEELWVGREYVSDKAWMRAWMIGEDASMPVLIAFGGRSSTRQVNYQSSRPDDSVLVSVDTPILFSFEFDPNGRQTNLLGNRLDAHLPNPLYTQSVLSGQGGNDARPEPTMSLDRLEVRLDPGTSRGVRAGDGQDRRLVVHLCYV